MRPRNPYVPVNAPAVGDLMNLFDFDGHQDREAMGESPQNDADENR